MPAGLTVIGRKKLCIGERGRRVSGTDAAKASAASDKNVRDVFEQHLCWPEGRASFMGRVNASLVARLAVMNTDGTALAA
ncbi:hypothetical protein [Pectobacterium brasiliense]|uniref:hypothetical protein n=1 Tax=Pectobacterium brasiliense TaxID=180957 RepID=UPI000907B045|nr:hypothetical protein [Pectobacterium brasiliense]MDY4349963.1 hypothetical protein [Pectobacterium brasiliense]